MLVKNNTRNANISVTEPIYIQCTKGKGIKFTPVYVHHDTQEDEMYYKVELTKRNDEGIWEIINGDDKWNIYQKGIEDLFNFISATTELKTKESIVSIEVPEEQVKVINSILSSGNFADILKSGALTTDNLLCLKNTVRISELETAISELEKLLLESNKEKDFENWCNRNIWAFGNYYVATENIHQISNAEKVDLLVSNAINCFRDIVEFKKPSFPILKFDQGHNNYYFSDEVSMAIGQVLNYSDVFSSTASQGLHRHEEILAYYPKSIIVIGRSNNFDTNQIKALHGLNSRLNGIVIKSYDEILSQAKNTLRLFSPKADNDDTSFIDNLPF